MLNGDGIDNGKDNTTATTLISQKQKSFARAAYFFVHFKFLPLLLHDCNVELFSYTS